MQTTLSISQLRLAHNIRTTPTVDQIRELAQNILESQQKGVSASGIRVDLQVYPDGEGMYVIQDGQCRYMSILDLIKANAGYVDRGLPVKIVSPPRDIWDDTETQIALNELHQNFTIFDLARRAVMLWQGERDGRKTTWQDVCDLLGHTPGYWSARQYLLNLITPLQEAVLRKPYEANSLSDDAGWRIGRYLTAEQQAKYLNVLLTKGKNLRNLEALIEEITAQEDMTSRQTVDVEDQPEYDYPAPQNDDDAPDQEAVHGLRQIARMVAALEELNTHGLAAELHTLGYRLLNLAAREDNGNGNDH